MVAGPGLHRARAVRVSGSKRFGHWGSGLPAGVPRPTQSKLQCGSLRKSLKWWQPLWERDAELRVSDVVGNGQDQV